jgi:hypothetical protein
MKYLKPEIVAVTTATIAIQGGKGTAGIFEGAGEQYVTSAAYEADE